MNIKLPTEAAQLYFETRDWDGYTKQDIFMAAVEWLKTLKSDEQLFTKCDLKDAYDRRINILAYETCDGAFDSWFKEKFGQSPTPKLEEPEMDIHDAVRLMRAESENDELKKELLVWKGRANKVAVESADRYQEILKLTEKSNPSKADKKIKNMRHEPFKVMVHSGLIMELNELSLRIKINHFDHDSPNIEELKSRYKEPSWPETEKLIMEAINVLQTVREDPRKF